MLRIHNYFQIFCTDKQNLFLEEIASRVGEHIRIKYLGTKQYFKPTRSDRPFDSQRFTQSRPARRVPRHGAERPIQSTAERALRRILTANNKYYGTFKAEHVSYINKCTRGGTRETLTAAAAGRAARAARRRARAPPPRPRCRPPRRPSPSPTRPRDPPLLLRLPLRGIVGMLFRVFS